MGLTITTDASMTGYGVNEQPKELGQDQENVTYQLSKDGSCFQLWNIFSIRFRTNRFWSDANTTVVQISTNKGSQISTPLSSNVVSLEMGNSSQCLSERSLYCREKEYSSRPFEPSPYSTNGMIMNILVFQKNFKFQISGHPLMDMFASIHNMQTQIFCIWFPPIKHMH